MQDKPLRAVCFADELLLTATEDDQIRIYQMENDQMKLVQTIVMDGIEAVSYTHLVADNAVQSAAKLDTSPSRSSDSE